VQPAALEVVELVRRLGDQPQRLVAEHPGEVLASVHDRVSDRSANEEGAASGMPPLCRPTIDEVPARALRSRREILRTDRARYIGPSGASSCV
jgi:hypothetical protein